MISFILNGTAVDIAAEDKKPLLWVLREDLDVLRPRYGCGVAQCGACRVLIDGVSTPEVTVEIMPSDLPPGRAGEIGNVPVAAAVANAIHAATGRRLRSLPLAITEPTGERQTRSVLRKSAAAGT